ncbi:MAG: hypothetical protein V8R30_07635 [Clostridia bacterium]
MLIGITGLHGAGKSYFCNTIPPKFGFKVFSKKQELARIYKAKFRRYSITEIAFPAPCSPVIPINITFPSPFF